MHDVNAIVDIDHPVTVEEYERIVAERDLERVELIDGAVHELAPTSDDHVDSAFVLLQLLIDRFPDLRVRPGGSVRFNGETLFEPDVYVANPRPYPSESRYTDASDVHLAVEVAVSTWSKDMGVKRSAYARAGIAEYWVVDPKPAGRIVRHTRPVDGSYRHAETVPLPHGLDSLTGAAVSLLG